MFDFLIRDKKFYRILFSLAIPSAMVNLISFAVTLGDSIMLGKLGESAMSAANLANQLWFMVMIIVFGTVSGSLVFASQYWGKGDIYSMKRIITIMIYIALGVSFTAGCLAIFIPETVMSWYTEDPEVIKLGAEYLRVVGYCYPAYAVSNAFVSVLRSAHITKISLIIYIVSLFVNLIGNYAFIFGNFGAPKMGVAGAALGTALARFSELFTLLIYLTFFEHKINYRFSDLFVPVSGYIRAFAVTSLPVVLNETFWGLGTTCISMVIGHIGTDFVAANSIANTAWQAVHALASGIGSATAVCIGNAVGSGEDRNLLMRKAKTIFLIALLTGLFTGLSMILVRPLILMFYDITTETKILANDLMVSYALSLILESINLTFVVGILRGGGDTKFAAFVDVTFLWVLALPLGCLTGFVFKLYPPIVYLCLKSDGIMKTTLGIFRMLSGKWIHDVTVQTERT